MFKGDISFFLHLSSKVSKLLLIIIQIHNSFAASLQCIVCLSEEGKYLVENAQNVPKTQDDLFKMLVLL